MGHLRLDKRYLPLVVKTIAEQSLEGILDITVTSDQTAQLFFRKGQLIHISTPERGLSSEEQLHKVLNWPDFMLDWQPLPIRLAQPNINAETRVAFVDVLLILTQNGHFHALDKAKIEPLFFSRHSPTTESEAFGDVSPVELTLTLPNIETHVVSRPVEAAATNFSLETNLLLPPGQKQDQLEELLGDVAFREQFESLSKAHFTGYAYYSLLRGEYGLLLFENGTLLEVVHGNNATGLREFGSAALRYLTNLKPAPRPEIYRVQNSIVKAYRATINCPKPQNNIAGTPENLKRGIEAFAQYKRDGVIMLFLHTLKMYYFFMFEDGKQIGVFAPESQTGRLQPLSAPLALPAFDANAHLSLLVSGQTRMENPTKDPEIKPAPQTEPQPLPEAVNWNGLFSQAAPAKAFFAAQSGQAEKTKTHSQATSKKTNYGFDADNPFDF